MVDKEMMIIKMMKSKNWQIKFVARNLLNPAIKQTQMIRNINTGITTNEVVSSYKKGSQFNLSVKYSF